MTAAIKEELLRELTSALTGLGHEPEDAKIARIYHTYDFDKGEVRVHVKLDRNLFSDKSEWSGCCC